MKPDISVEDEEQRALQEIRAKLARLDVSSEKRDGIIEGLADDPKTSVKVAGVLRHITPPDVRRQSADEIDKIAEFRKNLLDKLNEKQAALQEESKDGSFMELLLGLLKDFMTGKTDEDQDRSRFKPLCQCGCEFICPGQELTTRLAAIWVNPNLVVSSTVDSDGLLLWLH